MKKQTKIALVVISLLGTLFVMYRVKYVLKVRTWEGNILATLIALCAIAMLYIAYKEVLRRFGKGTINKEAYAVLYELEVERISGEVEFYFTMEQAKEIHFSILDQQMNQLLALADGPYSSGGHIIRFDSNQLKNGSYFYCLETANQKTMKRMIVEHDNLA